MGRVRRIDGPGGWHHVINRGAARQRIFLADRDRVEFERVLGVAHDRFGVRVHAYCLMGNHYHLLVECPDGGLSEAMHLVGSVYVRHFNARHGRDGPLFRDRFFAKPVHDDAYLLRLVRYIHRNPAAIVGEDAIVSYRWSSLRSFLGRRSAPHWLRTQPVLELYGGVDGLITSTVGATSDGLPDLAAGSLLAAIGVVTDGLEIDRTKRGLERTIASLLLDRSDGLSDELRRELIDALGVPTPAARRAARGRARRRLAADPELGRAVDAVLDLVA